MTLHSGSPTQSLTQSTLSSVDSRVSPSPLLAKGKRKRTHAGSGLSSPESLAFYDPSTSSLKMSPVSARKGSRTSSATWPRSGTMLSGTVYPLPPLVRLTRGTGFGSWPTPASSDTGQQTPEAHLARKAQMSDGSRKTITALSVMVAAVERGLWPTPSASDGDRSSLTYKRGNPTLRGAALSSESTGLEVRTGQLRRWPTPIASDWRGPNYSGKRTASNESLPSAVALPRFPTPTVTDARGHGYTYDKGDHSKPRLTLPGIARQYPTPRSSEWKGCGPLGSSSHESMLHKHYLCATAQHAEQRTGQLNPTWVTWLMGFPLTWLHYSMTEVVMELRKDLKLPYEFVPVVTGTPPRKRRAKKSLP